VDGDTDQTECMSDHIEAMMCEDGLQSDEMMRDRIDSVGTILREIYGSESDED
jgi:hypothetical protein